MDDSGAEGTGTVREERDRERPTGQRIAGNGLTATVDPRRGAKIVSLVDANGYEWLLPPRDGAYPPGTPFTEAEMGGWDECAPSIVPCTLADGREVPDHGDLWDVAWTGTAELRVTGRSAPYEFRRTISASDHGLRLDYEVTAERDMPFLWAAHPQFSAPPGTSVQLDVTDVVEVLDRPGARESWTAACATIDTVSPGGRRKVYADPDRVVDRAVLAVPGRGELELQWSGDIAPYVGLWFDAGAYARRPVIAIEPATGYYDSVAVAAATDRVLTLRAGTPVAWQVEVGVR